MDDELRRKFTDEALKVIKSRYEFIGRNYPRIREALNEFYEWPEMDTLRGEVCLCLFFGLHQAAITLTNHFFESLLKYALIIHDSKNTRKTGSLKKEVGKSMPESLQKELEKATKQHGDSDLGDNINKACSRELITKVQKKRLHALREGFRNAFGHSDKKKTFGDATMQVQGLRLTEGGYKIEPPVEVRVADFMIVQGLMQAEQAKEEAVEYFLEMHQLANQIRIKLFGSVNRKIEDSDQTG